MDCKRLNASKTPELFDAFDLSKESFMVLSGTASAAAGVRRMRLGLMPMLYSRIRVSVPRCAPHAMACGRHIGWIDSRDTQRHRQSDWNGSSQGRHGVASSLARAPGPRCRNRVAANSHRLIIYPRAGRRFRLTMFRLNTACWVAMRRFAVPSQQAWKLLISRCFIRDDFYHVRVHS